MPSPKCLNFVLPDYGDLIQLPQQCLKSIRDGWTHALSSNLLGSSYYPPCLSLYLQLLTFLFLLAAGFVWFDFRMKLVSKALVLCWVLVVGEYTEGTAQDTSTPQGTPQGVPLEEEGTSSYDWGLGSIRDGFEAVNGYFDSFLELLGGKNGVCQYRCRYGKCFSFHFPCQSKAFCWPRVNEACSHITWSWLVYWCFIYFWLSSYYYTAHYLIWIAYHIELVLHSG